MICEDMASYAANKALRKLGIKEGQSVTELLPKESATFDSGFFSMASAGLKEGSSYVVHWAGKDYSCIAKVVDAGDAKAIALGNLTMFGLDDTGEPFIVTDTGTQTMFYDIEAVMSGQSGAVGRVIGLSSVTETITPIDPKYLPGVCLPVVELSTEVQYGDMTSLSPEENAALTAAAEGGLPIVIGFNWNGVKIRGVGCLMDGGEESGYVVTIPNRAFNVVFAEGQWVVVANPL